MKIHKAICHVSTPEGFCHDIVYEVKGLTPSPFTVEWDGESLSLHSCNLFDKEKVICQFDKVEEALSRGEFEEEDC